jgi:hypothetical protein
VLLILGGVLFLLENLNILPLGDLFWMVLIGLGALFFLSLTTQNRENWWALIPGMTMLSIALIIGLETFAPALEDRLGGTIFLGGLGLSFLLINLLDRRQWWALIPFGVLSTLAAFVWLQNFVPSLDNPGLVFLGIGLTFALVALQNPPDEAPGDLRWAWIPSGILTLIGVIVMAAMGELIGILWPAALILTGLFLVGRTFLARS